MGVESPFLTKFPSMEVSNILVSPTSTEPVDPCGLTISWIIVLVGKAVVPPIINGPFPGSEIFPSHRVLIYLPVLLTCPHGFRRMCVLLHDASVMTGLVLGTVRTWRVPPQVANMSGIWGLIGMVMIGRLRLINNFCWKFPLLVSVTSLFFLSLVWVSTFGLLSGLPSVLFSS